MKTLFVNIADLSRKNIVLMYYYIDELLLK